MSTIPLLEVPPLAAERFRAKLRPGANGCVVWCGGIAPFGHGRVSIDARMYQAHRVAWVIEKGEIPDGLWVLHRCDNPPCCNVDHLWLGTAADNSADMFRKRRSVHLRGEDQPISKLTEGEVALIRAATDRSHASLARQFGVTEPTIRSVRIFHTWKHVGV